MSVSTRLAPGISAAAVALCLVVNLGLASAAFANDPMSADTDFRNSLSSQGSARGNAAIRKSIAGDSGKKEDVLRNYGSSK